MRDRVEYALNLGIISGIVNKFGVSGKINEIFKYRDKILRERFG